jgi:hypothetical protein
VSMIKMVISPEARALLSTPPSVTRIAIKDREMWLAARSQDGTASVIGAVMNCHEYTSLFDLWQIKTGRVEASTGESAAVFVGAVYVAVCVMMIVSAVLALEFLGERRRRSLSRPDRRYPPDLEG